MIHLTLVRRQLAHSELLLSELDSSLAREALRHVHSARLNVETLQRIKERQHSVHVLGERGMA